LAPTYSLSLHDALPIWANYLGAVYLHQGVYGFGYADLTTGEFRLSETTTRQALLDDLARVSPSELLVSDAQQEDLPQIEQRVARSEEHTSELQSPDHLV